MMARGRAFTILGVAVMMAFWVAACGDAEWPGRQEDKAPPLNAGPGTTELYAPPASDPVPGVNTGSILGDWFFCTGDDAAVDRGDPCEKVSSVGVRLRANGSAVGLMMGEKFTGKTTFPAPYCELPGAGVYSLSGHTLTIPMGNGVLTLTVELQGDRAFVTNAENQKTVMIRVNPPHSTGVCRSGPEPG
ncbi:MAG: hypothetical protein KAI47_18580 [Deltaproteobacteria bacterium]|nr:hypothetical protein [Deltaproteobacteria bacterium]